MTERDASFSQDTRGIIAGRAGYRCSFPGCDESTIGPGSGPTDIERKGVAAHIFSASTGGRGPRGTGGLSGADRSQPANGIWLCDDHAKIVDTAKGRNYPASQLQAWKALQEDRMSQELRKVRVSRFGWLERVTVEANPLFRHGTSITFGKVTLFVGNNGTGKSAICEWLSASAGNVPNLRRWAESRESDCEVILRSTVLRPDRISFALRLKGHNLQCEYGNHRVLDLSHAIRVVYVREQEHTRHRDDVTLLAEAWGIHRYQVPQVIAEMCADKYGEVRVAELRPTSLETEKNGEESNASEVGVTTMRLYARVADHPYVLQFGLLSSTERSQIIVAGAMVVADLFSVHQTTVLIVELGDHALSDGLLSRYASCLQSAAFRFQTILVSPSERPRVDWTGWSVARFVGRPPSITIQQDMIA